MHLRHLQLPPKLLLRLMTMLMVIKHPNAQHLMFQSAAAAAAAASVGDWTPALPPKQPARFPTFHGGGVLVDAGRLKDVLHGQDEDVRPAGRRDSRRRR